MASFGAVLGGRARLGLVFAAVSLLLGAWVVATRPFDAPDEASHYLRAMTIANGQLVGPKIPLTPVPAQLSPAQLSWVEKDTTAVQVSGPLAPGGVVCVDGRPDLSRCTEATEAGNYAPLPYLLPGLAISASSTATTALWRARAVSAALCLAFLLLAVALCWDGTLVSILGVLAAISPMVLFVCSILNPNGLEVAASLAFGAGVLRVSRDPGRVPRHVWGAVATAGAATILAWQLGPLFVAGDLALGLALIGRTGALELWRGSRRAALATAGVLGAAVALYVGYGLATGLMHSPFRLSSFGPGLHVGLQQLGPVFGDAVGTFGILTIHLPLAARWIWWLLVLSLIAGALWAGTRTERRVLIATVVLAVVFTVLFYAWSYRFTGFAMQGRYVLPLLCCVPLLAGEVLRRHWGAVGARRYAAFVPPAVLMLIACLQAYAWSYDARIVAGDPGSIGFFTHATFIPPLGWAAWSVVAAGGVVALLTCAGASLRGR
ncbi:MAG: DUF2142 domain-containing protein [Solirubrobacteraceae bacterium]